MRITIVHIPLIAFIIATAAGNARRETVIPLKGQGPEQIKADVATCKS